MRITVQQETKLPNDTPRLAGLARREGFDFVDRLVAEWDRGENRFADRGEVFLAVHRDGRLIGFGGLNRDPYCADEGVGRVRHVYLAPSARGCGAGRALVREIVESARPAFSKLRLATQQAAPFYEHLGFLPATEHKATHVLMLS